MSAGAAPLDTIGLDFGTTNSVLARPDAAGGADLIRFTAPDGPTDVFRSALCFWQEEDLRGALSHAAGPWAIAEFLDFPLGSRFLQSFKSIAANPSPEPSINLSHGAIIGDDWYSCHSYLSPLPTLREAWEGRYKTSRRSRSLDRSLSKLG